VSAGDRGYEPLREDHCRDERQVLRAPPCMDRSAVGRPNAVAAFPVGICQPASVRSGSREPQKGQNEMDRDELPPS
jgi:hypothetical protein